MNLMSKLSVGLVAVGVMATAAVVHTSYACSEAANEAERPHPPHMAFMAPPSMPLSLTRNACENRLNSEAAMAGFFKSKLHLSSDERQAWNKIEDAAQPSLEQLRLICGRLPVDGSAAPSLLDMLDVAEAQTSARLDLIRATREPIRAFYAMLTPEQRAALEQPAPPKMPQP